MWRTVLPVDLEGVWRICAPLLHERAGKSPLSTLEISLSPVGEIFSNGQTTVLNGHSGPLIN